MPGLVGYLLLFVAVGAGFIFVHLLAGKFIRPAKPHDDKLTIYECGEPTIGSAWVQFDLRFYVVALLFVIFDVEVAFFFPWAVVYGKLTELGKQGLADQQRIAANYELAPEFKGLQRRQHELQHQIKALENEIPGLEGADAKEAAVEMQKLKDQLADVDRRLTGFDEMLIADKVPNAAAARNMAWIAFLDIAVFFGVLLVGFAYLWRRGDLNWVRSVAAEREQSAESPTEAMAAAGTGS
jgi:NADH-quinone oxidoreductase subunit A